ncbi:MAG: hypothetical protein FVQ81_15295 [Candidatus Glassbacteria bacterium]|nr:hypothetical protein [Candidatus Glassbacteria bacterium]
MRSFRSVLLLIAALMLTAGWNSAQGQTANPGDPVSIFGKVVSFGTESITLEVGDLTTGASVNQTFILPPATPVVEVDATGIEGANISLQNGQYVELVGTFGDNGEPLITKIRVMPAPTGEEPPPPGEEPPPGDLFGGVVRSNDGTTLQLEGFDDVSQTTYLFNVTLATDGKVFDLNDIEIPLSNIPVGNLAHGIGEKQANGDFIAFEIYDGGLGTTSGGGDPPPGGDPWQPGDRFEFGGEVESLGSGFMILMTGASSTGEVHYDTVYYDSGIVQDPDGNPAVLSVGSMINGTVEVQTDLTLKFISLTVYPPGPQPGDIHRAGGQITEIGTGFIVVSWQDMTTGESGSDTLYIPSGLAIVDESGNPATLAVGSFVDGEVEIQADGSRKFISLTVYPPGPLPGDIHRAGGQITEIGTDFIVVSWQDTEKGESGSDTLYIPSGLAIVDQNGNPATLAVGNFVDGEVEIQADGSWKLISLTVYPDGGGPIEPGDTLEFHGIVISFGDDFLEVEMMDPDDGSVKTERGTLDANTVITGTLADSMFVEGTVVVQDDGTLLVLTVTVSSEPPVGDGPFPIAGVVAAVGADYLDIEYIEEDGTVDTVRVKIGSESALSDENGIPLSLADFAVGDEVHGEVDVLGPDDLVAKSIVKGTRPGGGELDSLEYGGVVVAVGGGTLDIYVEIPERNVVDTLHVLVDSSTVLLDEAGNPITLSDIAVGDNVHGWIMVDNTGVLTAISVFRMEELITPGDTVRFYGRLVEFGSDFIAFEYDYDPATGNTRIDRFSLAPDVTVTDQDGNPVALAVDNFIEGRMIASVDSSSMAAFLVILHLTLDKLPGDPITVGGEITELGPDYVIIRQQDDTGQELIRKLQFLSGTEVFDEFGAPLSRDEIAVGDRIRGEGLIQPCSVVIMRSISLEETITPIEPDTVEIGGEIVAVGAGFIEFTFIDDSTGERRTVRGSLIEGSAIIDLAGNPITPEVGHTFVGTGVIHDVGELDILSITIDSSVIEIPLPGEFVELDGEIIEIEGNRVNLSFEGSDAPLPSAWLDIPVGTPIVTPNSRDLEFSWLEVGDLIGAEGIVNDDSISVTASKVIYLEGTLRVLVGRVVSSGVSSFDFETHTSSGQSVVVTVNLGSSTRIIVRDTGEEVGADRISRGASVSLVARQVLSNSMNAILVTVPQLERAVAEGRVLVIEADGFSIEIHNVEENVTIRAKIVTSTATVWLVETDTGLQPASEGDLAVDDLVRFSGIKTGPLTVSADTVIILDTGELEVETFTLVGGKIENAVLTFQFNLNENTELPAAMASVSAKVSPDFSNLAGQIDFGDNSQEVVSFMLVKVSGTSGLLTGRWSGFSQAGDDDKVLVTAEFFQSGSNVTGTVTRGGQAGSGTDGIPEPGDEVFFSGQVSSVEDNTIIVSFLNRLNQQVEKPVLVHDGTEIVNVNGRSLELAVDSLLAREVNVFGIIQDNLTVVASRIEVYPLPGEDNVSINLPFLTDFSWSESSGEVSFAISGSALDAISTDFIQFSGLLSADGNHLRLTAVSGSDSLFLAARRFSGDADDIEGEWTGGISVVVSDRTKIWPLFLGLAEHDGTLAGVYELGESRFKTEVTTRNNPPVIDPFAVVLATEQEALSVQVTASDPDGDPVALSVIGVPITGSSFTDNGDGTGVYQLTIPLLAAGRTELLVTFVATDSNGGQTSRVLKIKVTRLNRDPELPEFSDTVRIVEGRAYSVTIPARDPDGGELEFEFSGLPEWASTAANQVNFEPPFGSAGLYTFTVTVKDEAGAEVSRSYSFIVVAANRAPRFIQIDPLETETGSAVSFTLQATDPDAGDVLTFSAALVNGVEALPQGATFDAAGGQFSWTPSAEQAGPFRAGFVVSDSKGAKDKMAVTILVGQGAAPPTLDVPDSVFANQGESASFSASGQSSTGAEVEFMARHLPHGAAWSTLGDSLEWYPRFDQQGEYVVTISASDGSFRTDKDVVIVVNPVQQIPTLEPLQDYTVAENQVLRFQVKGLFPDGRHVVFDPPAGLPLNSGFDPLTGSFRFLPDFTQAGSYKLTFGVTLPDSSVHSVSTTVTVTDKNRNPKFGDLENVSVNAGETVAFTVSATDLDIGDVISYAVVSLPDGAAFDTSVDPPTFSWTSTVEGSYEIGFTATDQAQGSDRASVIISVGAQNLPPVLGQIGDVTVAEGDNLVLTISASDPEGEDVTVFISPVPVNASFDKEANTFTFQPSYAQAGRYSLRIVATDGELTDEERVVVTVTDVPLPPTITVPANWTVDEGDPLQFTVNVRDAAGNRIAVLSPNLPSGASLESETGRFNWQPLFDQAGEYQVTFNAADGNLRAQSDIKILVQDRNQPPELFRVDDQEVVEGDLISFEISVFDPDGDEVGIGIDSSGTPYISSAEIRNNSVFVFNTALLDANSQIPSAVFKVTADDSRGGVDTMRIEFKIIRRSDVDVPEVPPGGDPFAHEFTGTGLSFRITNNGSDPVSGQITGSETSGTLEGGNPAGETLLAGMADFDLNSRYPELAGSKDKVKVLPFLSDDGAAAGDFYGVRRGWGLDLSSDLLSSLTSLQFELTLTYQDRDIPATDIPEFEESAISVFGLDAAGNFVQLATQLDTAANTATASVDLLLYTDFTLGVILDLAEPVISFTSKLVSTTNESGPYNVTTIIVDNVLLRTARLYYSTDGENYNFVEMKPDTTLVNGFTGDIPGQKEGNTIYYYIEASDEEYTVTDPATAPGSAYQFSILLDGVAGVTAGDSNDDGKIDIFDVLDVLSILGGKKGATAGADADGNGRVDIFDLLDILTKLSN